MKWRRKEGDGLNGFLRNTVVHPGRDGYLATTIVHIDRDVWLIPLCLVAVSR